ncbi:L-tyrosine/L-tryptophan isonitrile synthase family protein [Aliikangiella sp. IMCC44359]|uniref:L-tyrosine/L-tryptophan isonitrile synthase family protein n=1 Tax=Aliikangiella sp. IMCC44359 TaxID=3459125 RepID=UPI00403B037E
MNSELVVQKKLSSSVEVATNIIKLIFARRRLLPIKESVAFSEQAEPHLDNIINCVEHEKPIKLILPAFPVKSPNRRKTLSHLPDYGEFLAMTRLVDLCKEIENIYSPGAKLIICSDGRVFADVIHVSDSHVTEYGNAIKAYAMEHLTGYIEFYNLDNVYEKVDDFAMLREELMIQYGESWISLRRRIKNEREASTMYLGITKFMLEDFSGIEKFSQLSRTALQKKAKLAAYRVIQRSNAWSRLLKKHFPEAVRLSIHPQYLVSEKIGISMLTENDVWTTPWHSVVVKHKEEIMLLPKEEAEKLGCVLVYADGKPSHFEKM